MRRRAQLGWIGRSLMSALVLLAVLATVAAILIGLKVW
jgi:hypothetical protein